MTLSRTNINTTVRIVIGKLHYNDGVKTYLDKLKLSSPLMVTTVCPYCGEPIVVRSTHLEEDIVYYAKSCPEYKTKEVE
jgi:hypothetical protein